MSKQSRQRHLARVGQTPASGLPGELISVQAQRLRLLEEQNALLKEQVALLQQMDVAAETSIARLVGLLDRAGVALDLDKPGAYELMAQMAVAVADYETWQQAKQDPPSPAPLHGGP